MKHITAGIGRQRILAARARAEATGNIGNRARCPDCEDHGFVMVRATKGGLVYTLAEYCPSCPVGRDLLQAHNRETSRINEHRRRKGWPELAEKRPAPIGAYLSIETAFVDTVGELVDSQDCPD